MPELADDPRFGANAPRSGRADHADEIDQRLAPWLMSRSRSEVVDALQGHHVPRQCRAVARRNTGRRTAAGARLLGVARGARRRRADARAPVPAALEPFRVPRRPQARPAHRASARRGRLRADRAATARRRRRAPQYRLTSARRRGRVPTPIVRATRPTRTEASAPRLLEGIRVVEFGYAWAGPVAARTLGDLGADVIKVEQYTAGAAGILPRPNAPGRIQRSGSQPHAGSVPAAWNRGGSFTKMNRNKRGLCADLKTPEGKAIWRRLVESADVVLDNFSPRGSRSLGIDHATIRVVESADHLDLPRRATATLGPCSSGSPTVPSSKPTPGPPPSPAIPGPDRSSSATHSPIRSAACTPRLR